MILSLAIIINAIAALSLIGGLAYTMSRTTLLTPHLGTLERAAATPTKPARRERSRLARRPVVALASARS